MRKWIIEREEERDRWWKREKNIAGVESVIEASTNNNNKIPRRKGQERATLSLNPVAKPRPRPRPRAMGLAIGANLSLNRRWPAPFNQHGQTTTLSQIRRHIATGLVPRTPSVTRSQLVCENLLSPAHSRSCTQSSQETDEGMPNTMYRSRRTHMRRGIALMLSVLVGKHGKRVKVSERYRVTLDQREQKESRSEGEGEGNGRASDGELEFNCIAICVFILIVAKRGSVTSIRLE
ncbi:hypothetical protein Sjap_014046 [Stephania japonica]|uniref:Uncharacterized protein n=1 Tax=Stephania japonica TaxID=461633 RepID=A0AAP0IZ15_9MAGN